MKLYVIIALGLLNAEPTTYWKLFKKYKTLMQTQKTFQLTQRRQKKKIKE